MKDINREAMKKAEAEVILKALEMTNWNRKKAAYKLNISYKALLYKIKETGLDKRYLPRPLKIYTIFECYFEKRLASEMGKYFLF